MRVVSQKKQRSERGQMFHFNSGEVKQRREPSHRFRFHSSESKAA